MSMSRLGLVWESEPIQAADGRTVVVRVVHKGTSVRERGGWLASAPEEVGIAALVVGLPVRVVQMLVYRDRFKVATVHVDPEKPDRERVLDITPVTGEQAARTAARDRFAALSALEAP